MLSNCRAHAACASSRCAPASAQATPVTARMQQAEARRRSRRSRAAVRAAAAQQWPESDWLRSHAANTASAAGQGGPQPPSDQPSSTSAQPGNGSSSWNGEYSAPEDGWSQAGGADWEWPGYFYYYDSDWGEPEPVREWGEEGAYRADFQVYTSPSGEGDPSGYSGAGGDDAYGPFSSDGPQFSGGPYGDDERRASGAGASSSAGDRPLSDITLLTREEMELLMPVPPTRSQTNYYQPKSLQERLVQIASSLGVSLALSKSALLAAPVLLYPIWSPWVKASCKNLEVYTKQLRCLGLWRAQVLEVQVLGGSPFTANSWAFGRSASRVPPPTVRILVGDGWPSGARVQLEFPYTFRSELLAPGEPVEMLVLSQDATFMTFKVIREVYAPGLGLWLSDYPFIDKSVFLDVSLQIENERQADMAATVVDTHVLDVEPMPPASDAAASGQQEGFSNVGAS